jgi:guanylate kinase
MMSALTEFPVFLIVSAPSGAGKSTLCRRLMDAFDSLVFSVSCTTRAPRGTERNGREYFFLTPEQFENKVRAGEFLEYAQVYGHRYGTLKSSVLDVLRSGRDVLLDIDVQGAAQVRAAVAGMSAESPLARGFVDVFILPPSMEELRRRLISRATDAPDVVEKRIARARDEMEAKKFYRQVICNDNLEEAAAKLRAIYCAKKYSSE